MCESHNNRNGDRNALEQIMEEKKRYTYLGSDPVGQDLGRVRDEQATEP